MYLAHCSFFSIRIHFSGCTLPSSELNWIDVGYNVSTYSCPRLETRNHRAKIFVLTSLKFCIKLQFSITFTQYVKVKVKSLSRVWLFATPWTIAYQASQFTGFSRQEYWSGLTFPSLRDLPDPGIEPGSPTLQADALPSEPPGKPMVKKPPAKCRRHKKFRFDPWVEKITWRRKWQLTPVFLPGESHGQRSLVGYSP